MEILGERRDTEGPGQPGNLLEADSTVTSPPKHRRRPRFEVRGVGSVKKLAVWGGALTTVVTGVAGAIAEGSPLAMPRAGITGLTDLLTDTSCSFTPPQSALNEVNTLLKQPPPPEADPDNPTNLSDEEYNLYVAKQAKDHGLTVTGYQPYLDRISTAQTSKEVTDVISSYTEQYGFPTTLTTSKNNQDPPWAKPVNTARDEERVLWVLKKTAPSFIRSVYPLTKEVTVAANITEVKIIESITDAPDKAAQSHLRKNATTIYIPFMYLSDIKIPSHETGHALDGSNEACGELGMNDDPELNSLNPVGSSYGSDNPIEQVPTIRESAQKSMSEEKGVNYGDMLGGLNPLYYKDEGPVGNKYRFLLARLHSIVDNIAGYLFTLRPQDPPKEIIKNER